MPLDCELHVTRAVDYPVRAQDLVPRAKSVWLLVIVHLVGGLGFAMMPHTFARLVPLHLLFCLAVWLVNQPRWNVALTSWFLSCGVLGFGAEVLGVRTALLFGSYSYGPTLGPKLWDVPVMMAVNWSLLTAIVADVSAEVREARGWGPIRGALLGSLMLVAIDGFLEPFAVRYDLWQWTAGAVPIQNYVGWGGISFALLLPAHALRFRPNNPLSAWLLLLLGAFFAASWLLQLGAS